MDEKSGLKIKVPRFKPADGFYTSFRNSSIMKKIKSSNTKPEIIFRKAIWKNGVRYRIKSNVYGKPDLVIKKSKIVIFVDGDFWHGYKWEEKKSKMRTNTKYWVPKIERNIQRDSEINQILAKDGWTILRFWEHQIRKELEKCVETLIEAIKINS